MHFAHWLQKEAANRQASRRDATTLDALPHRSILQELVYHRASSIADGFDRLLTEAAFQVDWGLGSVSGTCARTSSGEC
eukprot:12689379-Alexandrium_andersonii.AAC.1